MRPVTKMVTIQRDRRKNCYLVDSEKVEKDLKSNLECFFGV